MTIRANDIQHGGNHYKGAKFQHWDLISRNRIGYLEGCSSKYATRWQRKNGLEDLQKGVHYCDKIVEMISECGYRPTGRAPLEDLTLFFNENNITDRDEMLAITYLCTWDSATEIKFAKMHLEALIQKLETPQNAAA